MRRRRGLGFTGMLAIVIAVVIAGGLTGVFPFRQIIASDRAVELAETKLEALRDENRRLDQQIAALHTREEVERLAREEFGLVMPGEIGYVSVPTPGAPQQEAPPIDDEPEHVPWWKVVWDFVTGRDLSGDE